MANTAQKIFVMRLYSKGATFYLSSRVGDVTLNNEVYQALITSVSEAQKIGNWGEGFQTGSCAVEIINAEQWTQGNYVFDVTNVVNNRKCEIKLCDPATETTWDACEWYYSGIIKDLRFTNNSITFSVDDKAYWDEIIVPTKKIEDLADETDNISASSVPKSYAGTRVPIQYGDLTDRANGVFAKCVTLSETIGRQIIVSDVLPMVRFDGVGAWEPGTKRFFLGRQKEVTSDGIVGEYEISKNKNSVNFIVDTFTNLSTAMLSANDGDIEEISVYDYRAIKWTDETNIDTSNFPFALGSNIISIDNELMQIIDKPTSNNIWVQRGYGESSANEAHDVDSKIYQGSQYSAKNNISFIERFEGKVVNNQISGLGGTDTTSSTTYTPDTYIKSGSWSNFVDNDESTYIEIEDTVENLDVFLQNRFVNFDVQFPRIEENFDVFKIYSGIKIESSISFTGSENNSSAIQLLTIWTPNTATVRNVNYLQDDYSSIVNHIVHSLNPDYRSSPYTTDNWSEPNIVGVSERWFTGSEFNTNGDANTYGRSASNSAAMDPATLGINSLSQLNKKWKCSLVRMYSGAGTWSRTFNAKMYNIGLWVEFFVNFTKRPIMAPLMGRQYNPVTSILIGAPANELATNPVGVVMDILLVSGDVRYFNTSEWTSAFDYYQSTSNFSTLPAVAFSYGVKESEKIWKFCETLSSHYMLSIAKDDDGSVRIINMHQLQNTDETLGYPGLTQYGISLDDILIPGTERLLSIQQTGTDRLKNDIVVKYKRNNSTDDFQASYTVPDTYVLPESGKTLAEARNEYYQGNKTETYVIESPFIYTETDAQRLAEWHANDKAEVFFWAEFTIDYDHYNTINSKSSQYKIGDVIYLDGVFSGITFDSSHPFVVRNVIKKDQGQSVELQCKSIDPISEFASSAAGQNDEWQDTYDSTTIYQDTYDNTTIYQDKS